MSTHKQSGFGMLAIIVIVAVLAIIGYTGYRVYTAFVNKPTGPQNVTADSNAGYVVIEEWAVRFKPVAGLNGVTTAIVSSTRPHATEAMLMTPAMEALAIPACNSKASGSRPLGAIVRTSTAEDLSQHMSSDRLLKKIGSYYYYYYKPSELCDTSASSTAIDKLQNDTLNQIESSVTSLEALNSTATSTSLSNDQLYQQVAETFNLSKGSMHFFRIFGQDKVQYSAGSNTYAYKTSGQWHQIEEGESLIDCNLLLNVPENYRPPCYDQASGQDRYIAGDRSSLNYPISSVVHYIGE